MLTLLTVSSGLAGLGFFLACVAGRPPDLVPTFYLGALLGILGIAATNFTGFVFSFDE